MHWACPLLALAFFAMVYGVPDYTGLPPGPYCQARGCCDGRQDYCSTPIIGKLHIHTFWRLIVSVLVFYQVPYVTVMISAIEQDLKTAVRTSGTTVKMFPLMNPRLSQL